MSSKRLDAISDYHRHGYMLRVECGTCERAVLIEPWQIVQLCQRRHWSRSRCSMWAVIQAKLAIRLTAFGIPDVCQGMSGMSLRRKGAQPCPQEGDD